MTRLLAFLIAAFLTAGLLPPVDADARSATTSARAAVGQNSGLPVPRFVSLRSGETNLRTGPGVRYPIDWVYRRKGLPMMVIGEYEYWRQVRDSDGIEGWIHRSLLSGQRSAVVILNLAVVRSSPHDGAPPVARAQSGAVLTLEACGDGWCRVRSARHTGWMRRGALFGVLADENFE